MNSLRESSAGPVVKPVVDVFNSVTQKNVSAPSFSDPLYDEIFPIWTFDESGGKSGDYSANGSNTPPQPTVTPVSAPTQVNEGQSYHLSAQINNSSTIPKNDTFQWKVIGGPGIILGAPDSLTTGVNLVGDSVGQDSFVAILRDSADNVIAKQTVNPVTVVNVSPGGVTFGGPAAAQVPKDQRTAGVGGAAAGDVAGRAAAHGGRLVPGLPWSARHAGRNDTLCRAVEDRHGGDGAGPYSVKAGASAQAGGTRRGLINLLFVRLVGRPATSAELKRLLRVFRTEGRKGAVQAFLHSPGYCMATAVALEHRLLRQHPDQPVSTEVGEALAAQAKAHDQRTVRIRKESTLAFYGVG